MGIIDKICNNELIKRNAELCEENSELAKDISIKKELLKKLKSEERQIKPFSLNSDKKVLFSSTNISDSLQIEIDKLQLEKDKLEKDINSLKFEHKKHNSTVRNLEKKILILKSDIENLQIEKDNLEQNINLLKNEKAILIDEIDNLDSLSVTSIENNELSIEAIDKLKDGLEFEKYFAIILDKLGFNEIKVTQASADFGVDVTATYDNILYGFQCKLYSNPVGNVAIQEIYAGKNHYNLNIGVVVTNSSFTEQARQQAKENNILLWDRNVLIKKLNKQINLILIFNKEVLWLLLILREKMVD